MLKIGHLFQKLINIVLNCTALNIVRSYIIKFTLRADLIPGADSNLWSDSTPGAYSTLESAPSLAHLSKLRFRFRIRKLVEL